MRRIFIALLFVLMASWGCHKKTPVATPAPPAPEPAPASAPPAVAPITRDPAPLESAPLSKTLVSTNNLELGEMLFRLGKYAQAAVALETYSNNPRAKNRDYSLYLLGLCRVPASDAALRRIISEHPSSLYKRPAEFILGLQSQIEKLKLDMKERDDRIKKLSDELQSLKEIDLQRKPSPSRPE